MFGSIVLATVVAWSAAPPRPVPPTATAPACPPPAPCVCVCRLDAGSPTGATTQARQGAVPAVAPAATAESPSKWYGGPAVAIDAGSLVLMLDGAGANHGGALVLGLSGFLVGAPINHLIHGRPSSALASVALRILTVGLATGVALEDVLVNHCDGDLVKCRSPAYAIAIDTFLVAGAMALDDALASAPAAGPEHLSAQATLAPGLLVGPSTAFASLGGRF